MLLHADLPANVITLRMEQSMRSKLLIASMVATAFFAVGAASASATFTEVSGALETGEGGMGFEMPGLKLRCGHAAGLYEQTGPAKDLTKWKAYYECIANGGPEAEPECSEMRLEQPSKEGLEKGKGTFAIAKECLIKLPLGCVVSIPVLGNQVLKSVSSIKEFKGVRSNVEVAGAIAKANLSCEMQGIKSNIETKIKIPNMLQEGLGLM